MRKPYGELIDVYWGDPHRAGMKPLTFVRQVTLAVTFKDFSSCKLYYKCWRR